MRYFLIVLLVVFTLVGCTINKQPIFIKVDNVKLVSVSSDTIQIKAEAFFENPNDVGGKITTDELKIYTNDVEVAQIFSDEFKVPARKTFQIPLLAKIPTKKLLNTNKNGVLGGLLNSLITRKINILIKGNLEYVVLGFKRDFLVNTSKELDIKF